MKVVCVSITHVLISLQLSQPGLKKGENLQRLVLAFFLIMRKFKAQKAITLVTGTLIILCKVTSFSLMKETSYQILTSTLLFLTKLVNKKKKIQVLCTKKHMRGVGRFRHNFSLIGLISFHSVKAVNSLHFSCLFLFYLHACPRKLPKQNNVFYKTTGTVGSIIRFRNVNYTCRYTHAKIFSLSYV